MWIITMIAFLYSNIALGDITLIGGTPVEPGEYPEVVYIRHGNSRCSASIVGPKAILTAGHCVSQGGEITYMLGQNSYKAKCKQTKQYEETEYGHDMAVCKADKNMKVKYASIAEKGPKLEDNVILIGYGCIRPGGGGGNDGILRVGRSEVYQLPTNSNDWYYTLDDAALCYGDSGGPSYKMMDDPKKDHHYIMGVNSRGDIEKISLLTGTYLEKSRVFLRKFAKDGDIEICGINRECEEQDKEQDEPWQCRYKGYKLRKYKGKVEKYETLYSQCLEDHRDFVLN